MSRLIDLEDAIDAVSNLACGMSVCLSKEEATGMRNMRDRVVKVLNSLPTAQPEIKPIEYRDCANAMLKMWMDNVVTDGEYNRIMDKLNAHWGDEEWTT